MKTGISLLSALLLAASGSVLAQQPGQDQPGVEPGQPQPGIGQPDAEADRDIAAADRPHDGEHITQRKEGQLRSDELVGSDVLDSAGESIGNVNELLIEEDGQIAALLVNVGGVVGVGGRTIAVSWDAAEITRTEEDGVFTDRYEVRTDMSRQQLEDAPEFEDPEGDQVFGDR